MMTGLALAAGGLVWFTRLGLDSTYVASSCPPRSWSAWVWAWPSCP